MKNIMKVLAAIGTAAAAAVGGFYLYRKFFAKDEELDDVFDDDEDEDFDEDEEEIFEEEKEEPAAEEPAKEEPEAEESEETEEEK